jgi:hypothetical protein
MSRGREEEEEEGRQQGKVPGGANQAAPPSIPQVRFIP